VYKKTRRSYIQSRHPSQRSKSLLGCGISTKWKTLKLLLIIFQTVRTISYSVGSIPSAARRSLKQDGHATTRLGSKNRDSAPLVSFQLSSHSRVRSTFRNNIHSPAAFIINPHRRKPPTNKTINQHNFYLATCFIRPEPPPALRPSVPAPRSSFLW
jgi:hypothetical protein